MIQRLAYIIVIAFMVITSPASVMAKGETTRRERKAISAGNNKYRESKWVEAASFYEKALEENPNSAEARYNLGLAEIRQVVNLQDTTARSVAHIKKAKEAFGAVTNLAKEKPGLAAKANYNLGNIEFNSKEYQKAIDYYKQTLRIDPNDDRARRNLRIAQLNLKNQQDKNQQNKNQDKQDQDKNKDKQQQNQQQNQQQQNQQEQKQQQDKQLSPQAAAQILQAAENKEAQVRARVNKASKGDKSQRSAQSNKKW
ncbi:MAG: tetratricopeptide repeat protein [Muribaculaceae bacterium]|nr:tetratricopeptide repeat protein [Muribaculaceae bacterium]